MSGYPDHNNDGVPDYYQIPPQPYGQWQPPVKPQQPPTGGNNGAMAGVLGTIIIVLVAFLLWGKFTPPELAPDGPGPAPVQPIQPDGGGDVIVEPTPDKTPQGVEGTYLVVVSESKGRPQEQISALNQYAFWREYLPGQKMKWYLLDPNDNDATGYVEYGKTQNMDPPFILHVRGTEPLWLEKFPPDGYNPKKPDLSAYKNKIESQ